MGITAQGIKAAQIGDAKASKNYLFITPTNKMNVSKEPKFELFENMNLLNSNFNTNNRFMSSMNPFIA